MSPWFLLPLLSVALAARPPDPEQAAQVVQDLVEQVGANRLDARGIYTFFVRPEGPPRLVEVDRTRTLRAFDGTAPLGQLLRVRPQVRSVEVGPDYTRVVLNTQPFLSFIVVRQGSRVAIQRWESTACGECREPMRFVVDLLADVEQGLENRLVPGLDLDLGADDRPPEDLLGPEAAVEEVEEQAPTDGVDWRLAWHARNLSAGYLRYALQGATVLEADVGGVRVDLRDRVENWPVEYEDGRWRVTYERLPVDSVLRLSGDEVARWKRASDVRGPALAWWRPLQVPVARAGTLLARGAVDVGYDPVGDRWRVVLQRMDRRLSGLVEIDPDGTVASRRLLPTWPEHMDMPVPGWPRVWRTAWNPRGMDLLVGAARQLWRVPPEGGEGVGGLGGLADDLTRIAWAPDGSRVALGTARGTVAVWRPASNESPVTLEVPRVPGELGGVVGLGWTQGGGALAIAWRGGVVASWSPGRSTVPVLLQEGLCHGQSRGMGVSDRRGEALVLCGVGAAPHLGAWVPLDGGGVPRELENFNLGGMDEPRVSPGGRWVVVPWKGAGGAAALCEADDLVPRAVFSDGRPFRVAWNADESELLLLDEEGQVTVWDVRSLLRG